MNKSTNLAPVSGQDEVHNTDWLDNNTVLVAENQASGPPNRLFRIPRLLPSWTAGPLGFATETTASRVTSRRTSPVREGLPVGQDQQLSKIRFEGGRPPQVL